MRHRARSTYATLFYLAVIGISTGFLVGLSLSPVVAGVLSSVLTLVLSAVGALAGLTEKADSDEPPATPKPHGTSRLPALDVRPVAAMCLALACGSGAGMLARSNDLFGPRPSVYLRRWKNLGIEDAELKLRILDVVGGFGTPSTESVRIAAQQSGGTSQKAFGTKDLPMGQQAVPGVDQGKLHMAEVKKGGAEAKHVENAAASGDRHFQMTGLYAGPVPPACAEARNTNDTDARRQSLQKAAHTVQPTLEPLVAACESRKCVDAAMEALCSAGK